MKWIMLGSCQVFMEGGAEMIFFFSGLVLPFRIARLSPTIRRNVLPLRCVDWLRGCMCITDRTAARL
jgi:hypothetical protein